MKYIQLVENTQQITAQFGELGTNGKPRKVLFFALTTDGVIEAMVINDDGELQPASELENYIGLKSPM